MYPHIIQCRHDYCVQCQRYTCTPILSNVATIIVYSVNAIRVPPYYTMSPCLLRTVSTLYMYPHIIQCRHAYCVQCQRYTCTPILSNVATIIVYSVNAIRVPPYILSIHYNVTTVIVYSVNVCPYHPYHYSIHVPILSCTQCECYKCSSLAQSLRGRRKHFRRLRHFLPHTYSVGLAGRLYCVNQCSYSYQL